jgi:undecaprenyl-diphosphatase
MRDNGLLLLTVALLCAAVALTIAVSIDDVLPGELRILREVQTWDWLGGRLAEYVRHVTTTEVVFVTGIAVCIALWLVRERELAVTLAIALVLLQVLQPSIKEIVDRPRPTNDVVDIRGSISSPSFPAGHVMSPTVLYGSLIVAALVRPARPTLLRAVIVATSAFILIATGFVNLHLGVHWPSDVLGGYLWGATVVAASFLLIGLLPVRRNPA